MTTSLKMLATQATELFDEVWLPIGHCVINQLNHDFVIQGSKGCIIIINLFLSLFKKQNAFLVVNSPYLWLNLLFQVQTA